MPVLERRCPRTRGRGHVPASRCRRMRNESPGGAPVLPSPMARPGSPRSSWRSMHTPRLRRKRRLCRTILRGGPASRGCGRHGASRLGCLAGHRPGDVPSSTLDFHRGLFTEGQPSRRVHDAAERSQQGVAFAGSLPRGHRAFDGPRHTGLRTDTPPEERPVRCRRGCCAVPGPAFRWSQRGRSGGTTIIACWIDLAAK